MSLLSLILTLVRLILSNIPLTQVTLLQLSRGMRRTPIHFREEEDGHLDKMIQAGVIRPSVSDHTVYRLREMGFELISPV